MKKVQERVLAGKWQCVSGCGACCNLSPEDRPDLAEYLSESELATYMSMVGEDGWCLNYDRQSRQCQIYAERPRFCRVQPDTFESMFDIPPAEFNDFAIACCQEQIIGVYGAQSSELDRYESAITQAED